MTVHFAGNNCDTPINTFSATDFIQERYKVSSALIEPLLHGVVFKQEHSPKNSGTVSEKARRHHRVHYSGRCNWNEGVTASWKNHLVALQNSLKNSAIGNFVKKI